LGGREGMGCRGRGIYTVAGWSGRVKVKEEVSRGTYIGQEGMDCRERDTEMVEGWSGRGKGKEEVSMAQTMQEGMGCR
jgi:hypothetical protein